MVLRCYFDGGNKPDSHQYETMSLAVLCGTEELWRPFEYDWRKLLKCHGAPYLHTTELVTRNGPYEGWTERQVNKFAEGAIKIAHKHFGRGTTEDEPGRYGIFPFVFYLNLKNFVAARDLHESIPRRADEIALRQSVNQCWEWGREKAFADRYQMVFDQGETFYGYMLHLKQNKQARKDTDLLDKTSITEGNMRLIPALQLADLMAWGANHVRDENVPYWYRKFKKVHFVLQHIDDSVMLTGDPNAEKVWRSLNMPKRKMHR